MTLRRLPLGLVAAGTAGLVVLVLAVLVVTPTRSDAALLLLALAGLAAGGVVVWHVDPAWTLCGALVLAVFNSNREALGISAPISPDRLLLAAAVGMALWRSLDGEAPRVRLRPVHGLLLVVLLYALGSSLAAGSLGETAAQFRLVDRLGLMPFAVYLVAPVIFATAAQRRALLMTLTALGAYLAATALFEATGLNALVWPSYILDPDYGMHFGRARGPFADAATNGLVLFACAGAAMGTAVVARRRPAVRWTVAAVAVACAFGLMFTLQRSVWVGSAVGIVVSLIAVRELRRWLVPGLLAAMAVVAVSLAVVPGLAAKAEERRDNDFTVWDRKNLNTAALGMVADQPLFGIGWGRFQANSYEYVRLGADYPLMGTFSDELPVHNVFLSNAAELGLVGATLWLVALVTVIGQALTRRGPPEMRLWQALLLAYAVAWAVVASFSPMPSVLPNLLLWLLPAVVLAADPRFGAGRGARA